jgi:hypothetical protein
LPITIRSPCEHHFKNHAQKYTQISQEKDKNNLFEKVLNAHLADRVLVARVTVMIFFKIVTEMFYSFFQMSQFFFKYQCSKVARKSMTVTAYLDVTVHELEIMTYYCP